MLQTEKEFLHRSIQFLIEKYSSWMGMKDPQENDEHFGNLHEIRQDMEKIKEYLESVPAETPVMPEPCTEEFNSFLLVNALRNLTTEQRHNLTISLLERDHKFIEAKTKMIEALQY